VVRKSSLGANGGALDDTVTITVEMDLFGELVREDIDVPIAPTRPRKMLPVFQSLAETVIEQSVRRASAQGKGVSCGAGCGACCRQLVPISGAESHALRDLIEDLPEHRRSEIRARFAEARRKLEAASMVTKLLDLRWVKPGDLGPLGIEYFQLGITCPFLEAESCSIHLDRPIACREYLVTSPAERCASPSPEMIDAVELPGSVSNALSRIDDPRARREASWVPLILAPQWAETHPDRTSPRTGPELMAAFMDRLADPTVEPARAPEAARSKKKRKGK
jgi:Fe-S-cluster containining protein